MREEFIHMQFLGFFHYTFSMGLSFQLTFLVPRIPAVMYEMGMGLGGRWGRRTESLTLVSLKHMYVLYGHRSVGFDKGSCFMFIHL